MRKRVQLDPYRRSLREVLEDHASLGFNIFHCLQDNLWLDEDADQYTTYDLCCDVEGALDSYDFGREDEEG